MFRVLWVTQATGPLAIPGAPRYPELPGLLKSRQSAIIFIGGSESYSKLTSPISQGNIRLNFQISAKL